MRHLPLIALASLGACSLPGFESWQAGPGSSSSDASTWADSGEPESTGDPAPGDADSTDLPDSSGDSTSEGTDTGEDGPPLVEPEKPEIVSWDLPTKVYAAGPVPLAVQTERTASVQVLVDGVEIGDLISAGDGVFTGDLPVRGAIDNGSHTVEIIAKQGEYQDTRSPSYTVATPAPGSEAWTMEGSPGSRTNRIAVAATGDLIAVGQTEMAGIPRPTLQLRSSMTGAELRPETILDSREGGAVDVAALADGRMWVAMNVRDANMDPRPRFVLLNADGTPTGTEVMGAIGRVVRAIAPDPEGGCFAVGVAGNAGDWDAAYWRIDEAGTPKLSDMHDYHPVDQPSHSFADLANDVVIDGDVAYLVGSSTGKHDAMDKKPTTRGMVVAMDRHNGDVMASLIAPVDAYFTQSAFFGAGLHGSGVLVTGNGSDVSNSMYRIETSVYNLSEGRVLHLPEPPSEGLAFGSDVVLDSQGRALVVGTVTQAGKRRAYLIARMADAQGAQMFAHWFAGGLPSEGLGVARDAYDRIFAVGYFTANGEERSRINLIHG
jgi:hypothetical protein